MATSSYGRDKALRPQVSLGRKDRLMTWSSNLNIYRVNRFNLLDLDDDGGGRRRKQDGGEESFRFDLIEQLLARNMLDVVESVFHYVGLESTARDCLLVCKLWRDFLTCHMFKRWAQQLVESDAGLRELAASEAWTPHLFGGVYDTEGCDPAMFRRICSRIFDLREVWRFREPKLRRFACDSFVLSLCTRRGLLYCGLNNGCLQLWDLDFNAKRREQEMHDKGLKCVDVDDRVIVTGSYDCTAKVWRKESWELVHVITLHTDAVWDVRLHDGVFATAGLDGLLGMFRTQREEGKEEEIDVEMKFLMQASQDLIAAVDFNDTIVLAGYEDCNIGVWDQRLQQVTQTLTGHTGGVTGLQLNGPLAASGSYDGTVRLWNVQAGLCLHVFDEPDNFVRCVGFQGTLLTSGDFGGHVHLWDVQVGPEGRGPEALARAVQVRNHRLVQAHKGHVVCVQLDARRIVSGSRDRTVLVQDFWAKMVDNARRRRRGLDSGGPTADTSSRPVGGARSKTTASRFLRR